MSFIIKGKKGLAPGERTIPMLLIGSRSTIPLPLDDATVAGKHCAIHEVEGGYELEDLNSSTGTYLNGVPIGERTKIPAVGATIVVGHCRIKTEIDSESGALILAVKEGAFFYDKKNDPLEWVRSEVSLGHYAALRRWMYVTVVLCLGLFAYTGMSSSAPDLLEPGAIITAHQDAVRLAVERGEIEDGCAACHDPWNGTPVESCDSCHAAKMADGSRYPFWTAAEWREKGRTCQECHLEHQGSDRRGLTDRENFRAIWGGSDSVGGAEGSETTELQHVLVSVAFNTFSHQKHLGENLACDDCHFANPDNQALADGPINRDYARVTFEGCMECHDPDASRSPARARFYVSWHGSDDENSRCKDCHESNHAAALKQVAREAPPSPGRAYEYVSHDHADVIKKMGDPAHAPIPDGYRCEDCHTGKKLGGARRAGLFRHFTHLSGNDASISQQCADCHTEVAGAESLARTRPNTPPDASCKVCHGATIPVRTQEDSGTTRLVNDFPHKPHLQSQHELFASGACFTCHQMSEDRPRGFNSQAETIAEAATCLKCHKNHAHVGLVLGNNRPPDTVGDCIRCHLPGDPAWFGKAGNPEKPVTKNWPRNGAFSHFSSGHVGRECDLCHEHLNQAKDLESLKIPDENQRSCDPCHREQRFHWK